MVPTLLNNLADLGAQVIPVGVVGDDEAGDALLRYFREKQISTRQVIRPHNRLTPTKTRILGGLTHWQRQQIVRVDREPSQPLTPKFRTRVTRAAAATLSTSTGVLVSDYGYGTTNAGEVDWLRRQLRRRPLPITVDSRYDLWTYKHLTAATPNEPEVEAAFGQSIGHDVVTSLGPDAGKCSSPRTRTLRDDLQDQPNDRLQDGLRNQPDHVYRDREVCDAEDAQRAAGRGPRPLWRSPRSRPRP